MPLSCRAVLGPGEEFNVIYPDGFDLRLADKAFGRLVESCARSVAARTGADVTSAVAAITVTKSYGDSEREAGQ
jgi:hypothetical protein